MPGKGTTPLIQFAVPGMEPELKTLWQACFQEPCRSQRFIFNNIYRPEHCLVYRIGAKAAAMVLMLPARAAMGGRSVPAHYIYGAATLPEYRGRGCMASLLAAAAMEGASKGHLLSMVLPATPELYKLYAKFGYAQSYHVQSCQVPAMELQAMTENRAPTRTVIPFASLAELQNRAASKEEGSALWGPETFVQAQGLNRAADGGKLILAAQGDALGFALARCGEPGVCQVTDFFADQAALPALAANLLCGMPAKTYHIRQPLTSNLFSGGGKTVFGMAKPLSGMTLGSFSENAFLSLTLD